MFYYYYDWTYILVLIGALICIAASARVKECLQQVFGQCAATPA